MAFKDTTTKRDGSMCVTAHPIKNDSPEYIISVINADGRPITAEVITGVNDALNRARELAEEHNCKYKFSSFPKAGHAG